MDFDSVVCETLSSVQPLQIEIGRRIFVCCQIFRSQKFTLQQTFKRHPNTS